MHDERPLSSSKLRFAGRESSVLDPAVALEYDIDGRYILQGMQVVSLQRNIYRYFHHLRQKQLLVPVRVHSPLYNAVERCG